MNTWQQLIKEFKELKARVDALEIKQYQPPQFTVASPVLPPGFEFKNPDDANIDHKPGTIVPIVPTRKPGRPRKVIEGEDVV